MAQPYIGEIRMFGGNFAPVGWALCQGQLFPISEYESLFNLIGTTYGGDGQSTFALPDLQSRVPIHMGTGGGATYPLAETGGVETVTLTQQQIPDHSHIPVSVGNNPGTTTPIPAISTYLSDEIQSVASGAFTYIAYDGTNQVKLAQSAVGIAGGSEPHTNIQPYLAINFIIALEGVFPSPT